MSKRSRKLRRRRKNVRRSTTTDIPIHHNFRPVPQQTIGNHHWSLPNAAYTGSSGDCFIMGHCTYTSGPGSVIQGYATTVTTSQWIDWDTLLPKTTVVKVMNNSELKNCLFEVVRHRNDKQRRITELKIITSITYSYHGVKFDFPPHQLKRVSPLEALGAQA